MFPNRKPEEVYREGFRVYTRYVDRYGFELLRDPNGKITRIGEQIRIIK